MVNGSIVVLMVQVYVVFTTAMGLCLIFGEKYSNRNPKTKFSTWWRSEVICELPKDNVNGIK